MNQDRSDLIRTEAICVCLVLECFAQFATLFILVFFRVSILVFAFLLTTFAQRDNMAWFNETVFWMLDTRKNTLEIDNLCSKIRIEMAALNRFAANLRQMRDYLRNCVCYCNKLQSLSVYSICIGHCQFLSVFIFSLHTIAFGVHKTTSTFITYQCRRFVFFFPEKWFICYSFRSRSKQVSIDSMVVAHDNQIESFCRSVCQHDNTLHLVGVCSCELFFSTNWMLG